MNTLDWRTLPDDYVFESEAAAERALGIPVSTLAKWRQDGRLAPNPDAQVFRQSHKRKEHPITIGEIRPWLRRYRPHATRIGGPEFVLTEEEWELVGRGVQLLALDATRSERKRCESLLSRLRGRIPGGHDATGE